MHPQSRPFSSHITPASIVCPYLSAQPQHAFLQCGGFNTHPVQYTTPFVEPRTSSDQYSSVTLSALQNNLLANNQISQYSMYQQPVAERSTFGLPAQNLPPPTDLFHTNSRPAVKIPTPESRGRKTIEDSVFHQNFVRKVSIEFFQDGQSLPLKAFCRLKGYIEKYASVRQFISNNPTLKCVQEAQSKTSETLITPNLDVITQKYFTSMQYTPKSSSMYTPISSRRTL